MTVTSVESQLLQANRDLLKNAMVDDVLFVSSELLRLNIITHNNHTDLLNNTLNKQTKVEMLMIYIENRVRVNPGNFTTFVNVLKTKEAYYSKAIQVLQLRVPGTCTNPVLPPTPSSDWQELVQLVKLHAKLKEELKTQGSHATNGLEMRVKELEQRIKETDQRIERNPYWLLLSKGFHFLFYLAAFAVLIFLIQEHW